MNEKKLKKAVESVSELIDGEDFKDGDAALFMSMETDKRETYTNIRGMSRDVSIMFAEHMHERPDFRRAIEAALELADSGLYTGK